MSDSDVKFKYDKVNFQIFDDFNCVFYSFVVGFQLHWPNFQLQSDMADFKHAKMDKVRGVMTDHMVCITSIVMAALAVKIFYVRVHDISMIIFMFQEITNFLCDNALRTVHLRYHFESERVHLDGIVRLQDGTDIFAVDKKLSEKNYCRSRCKQLKSV